MKHKRNTFTTVMTALHTGVDMALIAEERPVFEPQQPTSIRYRPQVKAVLDALSTRSGISLSELTNIILEDTFRTTFFPIEHQVTSIYERFNFLMDTHGLDAASIAALLARWNVKLSVLESRSRTLDHLSKELLETVAGWFRVNADWLRGYSDRQAPQEFTMSTSNRTRKLYSLRSLYEDERDDNESTEKLLTEICRHFMFGQLSEQPDEPGRVPGKPNEVIFWCATSDNQEECGILVREWRQVNGVMFETVYSWDSVLFFACRSMFIQLLRFCRHASTEKHLTYRTVKLDTRSERLLWKGRIMPRIVLDEARPDVWDVTKLMDEGDDDSTWRRIWDDLEQYTPAAMNIQDESVTGNI